MKLVTTNRHYHYLWSFFFFSFCCVIGWGMLSASFDVNIPSYLESVVLLYPLTVFFWNRINQVYQLRSSQLRLASPLSHHKGTVCSHFLWKAPSEFPHIPDAHPICLNKNQSVLVPLCCSHATWIFIWYQFMLSYLVLEIMCTHSHVPTGEHQHTKHPSSTFLGKLGRHVPTQSIKVEIHCLHSRPQSSVCCSKPCVKPVFLGIFLTIRTNHVQLFGLSTEHSVHEQCSLTLEMTLPVICCRSYCIGRNRIVQVHFYITG